MTSETHRIANLYRSVYEGDAKGEAWHGVALKPLLKQVTAEQASRIPDGLDHSIWQLVQHIAYWEEVVLRRVRGEIVDAPLNTPEDWPPKRKLSDSEWQQALHRLDASHIALLKAMEAFPENKLRETVPKRDHDYYALLHGIINHCVYHGGQIATVKKSVSI
jgi:uncharacterized damage-inducible protein DinB